MISSLSTFLNNPIGSLNIYDVFIIILFTLVLILCISSGIIILSSKIKKINLELSKNKKIQDVQDKIITNRLDLILNKLGNNSVSLSSLTNKAIKDVVINSSNDKLDIHKNEYPIESNKRDSINSDISKNTLENSFVNLPQHNKLIPDESEYIDIYQKKLPEDINLDEVTDEVTEKDNDSSTVQNEKIIDINDKLNKKSNIYISTNNDETLEISKDDKIGSNFDKGKSIPLEVKNKNQSLIIKDNEDISFYENDEEKDTPNNYIEDGIVLANKILNKLEFFTNEEKYEITNFISEDGKYITNFINNKLNKLTKKELIKQLLIQQLLTIYNYPIEDIEDNYEINLANNIYKYADIVVFNENNDSNILILIDTQNKDLNLRSLTQIAKFSLTPFIVWTNGIDTVYYKNTNGILKEISDIPQYEENIYYSNTNNKTQFISSPLYGKNYINAPQQHFNYNNYISEFSNKNQLQQQSSQYFSKDIHDIFKKQPYNLSDQYKSIISQYKNFSSLNRNNNIPLSQHFGNVPLNKFSHSENYIPNNIPLRNNYMFNNVPSYFAQEANYPNYTRFNNSNMLY